MDIAKWEGWVVNVSLKIPGSCLSEVEWCLVYLLRAIGWFIHEETHLFNMLRHIRIQKTDVIGGFDAN